METSMNPSHSVPSKVAPGEAPTPLPATLSTVRRGANPERLTFPADMRAWLGEGFRTPIEDNINEFIHKCNSRTVTAKQDWNNGFNTFNSKTMTSFEISVRLMRTMELDEWKVPTSKSFEARVTTLLNCEALICKLNAAIPAKQHPFLKHWVTKAYLIKERLEQESNVVDIDPKRQRMVALLKARLFVIRSFLTHPSFVIGSRTWTSDRGFVNSPEKTVQMVGSGFPSVDTAPFMTLLEDSGQTLDSTQLLLAIMDARETIVSTGPHAGTPPRSRDGSQGAKSQAVQKEASVATPPKTPVEPSQASSFKRPAQNDVNESFALTTISRDTKIEDVTTLLQQDTESAFYGLIRLPIDFPSLDLLTNILASPMLLESVGKSPVTLVIEYLQHSLRTIERMSPSTNGAREDYSDANATDQSESILGGLEEQIRAVKLLVMFLKNLLNKRFVKYEDVFMDVQEIGVRYLWVKEVREFRLFLDSLDVMVDEYNPPMQNSD